MRCFATLLLVATCCGRLCAQTVSTALVFDERVFSFGEIKEKDGKVSHTFYFKNTSKTAISIDEVTSGCGCTSHNFPKEPVRPGQRKRITITYNPLYRPGFFSKEIIVFSNNHKNISRVWIKGNVIPYDHPVTEDYPYFFGSGLYLSRKVLVFGTYEPERHKEIELRYANDSDKPMTLNFVLDKKDRNIAYGIPGKLAPKQRGRMIFSYKMPPELHGERIVNVYPVVNGKRLQPIQLKITGADLK